MEDARIVELYWERDEAAIAESSAKYGGYCYQIAFRILGPAGGRGGVRGRHLAAGGRPAAQPAPAGWIRSWGRSPGTWSLDRWRALRAQKRWQGQAELALTELGDCLPASGGVEQEVEAAALAESLNRFLESLPQEKRVLFVRRYWYLCSVEELAAWSGRRRGTVSAALFRLRQDLQEHLEREGFTL